MSDIVPSVPGTFKSRTARSLNGDFIIVIHGISQYILLSNVSVWQYRIITLKLIINNNSCVDCLELIAVQLNVMSLMVGSSSPDIRYSVVRTTLGSFQYSVNRILGTTDYLI